MAKVTKTTETPSLTEAEKIWNEIKDKKIEMFALPDQKVHQYCDTQTIEPTKLYLVPKATSVLPALETALAPKYNVDRMDRFIVVSRAK